MYNLQVFKFVDFKTSNDLLNLIKNQGFESINLCNIGLAISSSVNIVLERGENQFNNIGLDKNKSITEIKRNRYKVSSTHFEIKESNNIK